MKCAYAKVGARDEPCRAAVERRRVESNVNAAMSQHRNSVMVPLRLQEHPALQRCLEDTSYRVMVFCAADNTTHAQNIAFPHQSELRVNGGDIKANLRGLKNKPGSTRPVDVTHYLRLRGTYVNNLEFTYALTTKVGGGRVRRSVSSYRRLVLMRDCTDTLIPRNSILLSTFAKSPTWQIWSI